MTKTRNKILLPLFSPKSKSFKCAPTANEGSSVLTSYRNIGKLFNVLYFTIKSFHCLYGYCSGIYHLQGEQRMCRINWFQCQRDCKF